MPLAVVTRRYVGRVTAFVGARKAKLGRRTQHVATVRARWPSTPDFEKGEFVDVEEEEEVELWESNFGCANQLDQWVVYPGQLPGDEDGAVGAFSPWQPIMFGYVRAPPFAFLL